MNLVTKWCKGCGKIMRDVQPNKRFCEKCLHDKNLEYTRASSERRRANYHEAQHKKKVAAALPRRPHSIAWCVREAEKRGMSYGRFVGLGLDKEVQA